MTHQNPEKPIGQKSYGSIGHLPGSRKGPKDIGMSASQAAICLRKARDRHDTIIVQEKLDGSNVCVANVAGQLIALGRSGHPAVSSNLEHHRMFAAWVEHHRELFEFLQPGQRLCGEWLALAHGTIYTLHHAPFVAFDLISGAWDRHTYDDMRSTIHPDIVTPAILHRGGPCSIDQAMLALNETGFHGATEPAEGAVWRVERQGKVDFLAKYVRHDKVDGKYLVNGVKVLSPIWLYRWSDLPKAEVAQPNNPA